MDKSEQEDEVMVLREIFGDKNFEYDISLSKGKIVCDVELNGSPIKIGVSQKEEQEKSDSSQEKVVYLSKELKYIPPISLEFKLPHDYPSTSMPKSRLRCMWLTSNQIQLLQEQLNQLWDENKGSVILFIWSNFLQNEVMTLFNLSNEILIESDDPLFLAKRPLNWIRELEEYNHSKEEDVFNKSVYACDICFQDKLGKDSFRFHGCDHVYCKNCMREYFKSKIQDRIGCGIPCPTYKCKTEAFPTKVEELVPKDLYTEYENRVLETSTQTMTDVVRCPLLHCQVPSLTLPNQSFVHCSGCQYTFCIKCRKSDHGVNDCAPDLADLYRRADEEERKRLEELYDEDKLQEIKSLELIEHTTTTCPRCWLPFEKSEGCNFMSCVNCHAGFCYLCGSFLGERDPYIHYRMRGTKCFDNLFGETQLEDHEVGDPNDPNNPEIENVIDDVAPDYNNLYGNVERIFRIW